VALLMKIPLSSYDSPIVISLESIEFLN